VKGLGDEAGGPGGGGAVAGVAVVGGRHDQDGDRVGGGFEEAVEEGGGVDAGQVEVDQEQVGALGPDHAEAVVEVGGGDDLVAVDQDGGGDLGDGVVVVQDQHLGRGPGGRGDLGRGRGAGAAGGLAGQVRVGRGDPEDLLKGGAAGQGLGQAVGPHAAHAAGDRLLLDGDLGGRPTISSRSLRVTRTTSNRPRRPW
jgi:hypothetical protein